MVSAQDHLIEIQVHTVVELYSVLPPILNTWGLLLTTYVRNLYPHIHTRRYSKTSIQNIHDQTTRHLDLLQVFHRDIVWCRHTVQSLASICLTRYTGLEEETEMWI